MLKRIHHIGVAVADLDAAAHAWRDRVGLAEGGREDVAPARTRVHFLGVGESRIELLRPLEPGSAVDRFLDKRGPGVHHICIEVDDIRAEMARMRAEGLVFLNEEPEPGAHGSQVAFVHPRCLGGVLLELNEFPSAAGRGEGGAP